MSFKAKSYFASTSYAALLFAFILVACGDNNVQTKDEQQLQSAGAIQPEDKRLALTAQINSAPLFDSKQGWSAGYLKAIGHGAGVVVGPGSDNPNVFAQQFPANPGEAFRVVARATSVEKPKAMGRIQINWTGHEGKFISVSSLPFEVTQDEKTFEYVAIAPAGSMNGTLYVVPDGHASVVRYTEMRLLGHEKRTEAKVVPQRILTPPTPPSPTQSMPKEAINVSHNPFPKPPNLTPLEGAGRSLTVAESQYYFYHATKAMQRKALARGMDFIMYVMPDYNISRLMPAIKQLRAEGIKVLAYESQGAATSGVDTDWYWQKADSHWTEAAVRLTADEILSMWTMQAVSNRPFSKELMNDYTNGFPAHTLGVSGGNDDVKPVKRTP